MDAKRAVVRPSGAGLLLDMFRAMAAALGPSGWWPAETPFEVVVGAVLTQNANWRNVEKALANLRAAGLLDAARLDALPEADLAELIRPAGFYRVKAARLRNLLRWLKRECDFDLGRLAGQGLETLRPKLLAVNGVGRETADSVLLYALGLPTFVSDAYTLRVFSRHGLVPATADYERVRGLFMDVLPADATLFNEYHALIVRTGKAWCAKKSGRCGECPLGPFLPRTAGA